MKTRFLVLTATLCGFVIIVISGKTLGQDAMPLPPQAELMFNAEEINLLREKVQMKEWTQRWKRYKNSVDKLLQNEVKLPPRGGNWSHNYVCPEHARNLKQGKQVGEWEWEHICSVGPHILRGDPNVATLDFDGNVIMRQHGRLAGAIRDLGVVYQITGDPIYAKKAGEILSAYAEKYLSYPWHDNLGGKTPGKGGRVASQSLSEASWLIPLLQGSDMIWGTLDPDLRKQIEVKLIRPVVRDVILPRRAKIHNIQCWHDSAIGLAGYLLNEQKWIDFALHHPGNGLVQQLKQGVNADGMWYEGASSYHFYTILGMWPLLQAAKHHGVNLFRGKLKSMFDAPIWLAMPNGVLPDFSDSGRTNLMSLGDYYEFAYAHWPEARYIPLIQSVKRKGDLALWFGVSELKTDSSNAGLGSRNSPSSGYAILERGEGKNATWLCLKYGPHGSGHGHLDKNHFILYSGGQVLMPDAGMHRYGSPLHKDWDKSSVAHNTIVIDELDQARTTGQSIAFGSVSGVDYSVSDAGEVYPGVKHYRTVALLDADLIVVVDQVKAEGSHQIDLACHFAGEWREVPSASSWLTPDQPGYRYFKNTSLCDASAGFSGVVNAPAGRKTRIVAAGAEATQAVIGDGPGSSTTERVPVLLLRRQAKNTTFAWAVSLDGSAVAVDAANAEGSEGWAMNDGARVNVEAKGRSWSFTVRPEASESKEVFRIEARR